MASDSTDIESAVSTLNFLFHGHLVTYCIHIACKLNISGVIAEAGRPLSLQELEEKIHGEVNLTYLKRLVDVDHIFSIFIIQQSLFPRFLKMILKQNFPSFLSGIPSKPSLYVLSFRIIRFLCAFGIFQETVVGEGARYSLTSLSELLRDDIKDRTSLKSTFENMADPTCLKGWAVLEDCVRSKKFKIPFNEGFGNSSCDHGKASEMESADPSPHQHKHEDVDEHEHFDESIHETFILMKYYAHGFQDLENRKAHLMDLGMLIEYFLRTAISTLHK